MGAADSGKAFLEEILSKVPADRRDAVVGLIETAPELVAEIGAGVLRQAEFSSSMDRVRGVETQQKSWWEANQPLVDLGQKARDAGFDPAKPGTHTPALPADVVRGVDLDQREKGYAELMAWTTTAVAKHMQDFGEVLDIGALMRDPKVKELGLRGVYEAQVAPRYEEKRKQTVDAEVTRRVAEGVAAATRAQQNPNFPGSRLPAGSPLDALAPVETPGSKVTVDEMVDAYHAAVAQGSRA